MSEVEWVEESDWGKVKVGDRVKLKTSGDCYEFTVGQKDKSLLRPVGNESILFYKKPKSILFVERPVVALPTLDGVYSNSVGWLYLRDGGKWYGVFGTHFGAFSEEQMLEIFQDKTYPPLKPLRPVDEVRKETAKEVLDAVKSVSDRDYESGMPVLFTLHDYHLASLSRNFGVTDE